MSHLACRRTWREPAFSQCKRMCRGKYLNRAFSTPYSNSETQDDSEDTDEETDVYEPKEQV